MSRPFSAPVAHPSFAADPTVPTPRVGDTYWNTTLGCLREYSSGGWRSNVTVVNNTFSFSGTVSVKTGVSKWVLPYPCVIEAVVIAVNTAPTGASLIADVNVNGTSIYASTPANRPTIAAGSTVATGGTPNTTTVATNAAITVDVDQVGSTVAGADLSVNVYLRRTL